MMEQAAKIAAVATGTSSACSRTRREIANVAAVDDARAPSSPVSIRPRCGPVMRIAR